MNTLALFLGLLASFPPHFELPADNPEVIASPDLRGQLFQHRLNFTLT